MAGKNINKSFNVVGRGRTLAHLKRISGEVVPRAKCEVSHVEDHHVNPIETVTAKAEELDPKGNADAKKTDAGKNLIHGSTAEEKPVNLFSFDPVLLKSVYCEEFVPRQGVITDTFQDAETEIKQGEHFNQQDSDDGFIIDLINNTVWTLTESPGDYDYIINDFTDNLRGIKSMETMNAFVTILIEQAISEPNFLYSAVRIFRKYDDERTLEMEDKKLSFRRCLYPSLQRECESIGSLLKDPSEESLPRALGLSMLFADLLCNMQKNGQLLKAFLRGVFETIYILLQHENETTINCLVNMLKLIGPTLDEHKHNEKIAEVDIMFTKVYDHAVSHTWLQHLPNGEKLKSRLVHVYKLHLRNWDAEVTSLKAEASHIPQVDSTIDWNEYYDGGEDQFDPIDDDFEQFLKESGQL
eukprot:gene8219-9097_t